MTKRRQKSHAEAPTAETTQPHAHDHHRLDAFMEHAEQAAAHPVQTLREGTVGRVRKTLSGVHSRLLWAAVLSYVLAGVLTVAIVFTGPFRDPWMYTAMSVTLFPVLLLYVKADQAGRLVRRFGSWLVCCLALLAWAFLLADRIPAQRVTFHREVVDRDAILALYAPCTLVVLTAGLLTVHAFVFARRRAQAGPVDSSTPTASAPPPADDTKEVD